MSPLKGYLGLSVVLVDGGLDVADQIDQGVNHGILGNKRKLRRIKKKETLFVSLKKLIFGF